MFHREADLAAQNELEQELLDSMAPCCARDIMDMRRAADVTQRLKEVDPTIKAVDARMALRNPSAALFSRRRLFTCGDQACGDDCTHEILCEEANEEDEDDGNSFIRETPVPQTRSDPRLGGVSVRQMSSILRMTRMTPSSGG